MLLFFYRCSVSGFHDAWGCKNPDVCVPLDEECLSGYGMYDPNGCMIYEELQAKGKNEIVCLGTDLWTVS